MKGLVEDQPVLRLLHQAARQGVVEFDTVANIDGPARLDAIQRRRRTQPQPDATQRTYEMRDILVELLAPMPTGRSLAWRLSAVRGPLRRLLPAHAEERRHIVWIG